MDYPGNLFVVSAPSGAGKSSLVRALLELDGRIALSVSHTTRSPRGQEEEGREYFFVDAPTFQSMAQAGEFLEWANVHGHCYGSSKRAIESRMADGGDVILELDYQGALQVRKLYANAVLVFILPPSMPELRRRLTRRGEDQAQVIEARLRGAEHEMAQAVHFDFVIINEVFEQALFDLKAVVHAQRLRYTAQRRDKAAVFAALGVA